MLALTLAAVSLSSGVGSGWSNSMTCRDGGPVIAGAVTQVLAGTEGATAVLHVSSADDHQKQSHGCEAAYNLSFTYAPGEPPTVIHILSTDGAWGRTLSVELAGFSEDGKHILGILREGPSRSFCVLFAYETADRNMRLVLLPRRFVGKPGCDDAVTIAGTSGDGVVLDSKCRPAVRWLVEPSAGKLPRHLWGPDMSWNGDELSVGRVRRLRAAKTVVPLRKPIVPVDSMPSHD